MMNILNLETIYKIHKISILFHINRWTFTVDFDNRENEPETPVKKNVIPLQGISFLVVDL